MGTSGRARTRLAGALVALTLAGAALPIGSTNPAAAADDPLVYAALGDSYTSGPLVPPFSTDHVPVDCGQSGQNYPHLAALLLGVDELRDVSCGSASLQDLYEPQGPLPIGGINAPQLDALGPDVDVVTLGMGGNDVNFTGLAIDCVRLLLPPAQPPCRPQATGGVDREAQRIRDLGPELATGLQAIHAKAPNALVFVVGYPTSLPDSGLGCWPYLPILDEDMPYLVTKFKEMNAQLRAQAEANGATYVDIYTPSIGHDACQIPGIAWVNGVLVVPPSYPAHPNALSYLDSGPVVAQAIRAGLTRKAFRQGVAPAATNGVAGTATGVRRRLGPWGRLDHLGASASVQG